MIITVVWESILLDNLFELLTHLDSKTSFKLSAWLIFSGRKEIEKDDIDKVFRDFAPVCCSLRKVKNQSNLSWNDVGGMEKLKKKLVEIFIWPLKVILFLLMILYWLFVAYCLCFTVLANFVDISFVEFSVQAVVR